MTLEEFLLGIKPENWNNHITLLYEALEATKDFDRNGVVELGSGQGSTPYLRNYCIKNNRDFRSFDFHKDWAEQMDSEHVTDWNDIYWEIAAMRPAVILIDHSPGERRWIDAVMYSMIADFVVIHDTEPPASAGYKTYESLANFKYKRNLVSDGAWATICSNYHRL